MERDFMGLTVKQEAPEEEPIDAAAPLRSTAMHWPFSSKGPGSVPQLLSFGGDEAPKTGFESLISTGLLSLTTAEGFNSDHNAYAVVQKGIGPEKQGGIRNVATTYPAKHAVHRVVASVGSVGLSAQPLAGIPLTPGGPIVGSTDLRNSPKSSGVPAQLTIFYNGSVSVYDNILPEKAQAIMLLAGNGLSLTPSTTSTAVPAQACIPVPSTVDKFVATQAYGVSTHHSTLVSAASGIISQPVAKPAGLLLSSSSFAEPMKVGSAVGPVSSAFLPLNTVPQFRRKSLARFLEKRRERAIISASPYGAAKESPECGLSTTSSGSCAVPAIN